MDLIEEYLDNIANMRLSLDDYGDRKKVRISNKIGDRNRKIATIIEQKHPELKGRFLCLIESEDEDTRGWAAHHALEVMSYDFPDRQKALRAIADIAENSQDRIERLGNTIWLKQYFEKHPEDIE